LIVQGKKTKQLMVEIHGREFIFTLRIFLPDFISSNFAYYISINDIYALLKK